MEAFFCAATGKKLPGKHGQQDLSAALKIPLSISQAVEMIFISGLARLSLCTQPNREGLGEPDRFEGSGKAAWEGISLTDRLRGEPKRWRMRFSSDYRGKPRSSGSST
jgi:hypothetical protein